MGAKAMVKLILAKEVDIQLSREQMFYIYDYFELITRKTGAVICQVFGRDDVTGGLSVIGTEVQMKMARDMVRDIVGGMPDCQAGMKRNAEGAGLDMMEPP